METKSTRSKVYDTGTYTFRQEDGRIQKWQSVIIEKPET